MSASSSFSSCHAFAHLDDEFVMEVPVRLSFSQLCGSLRTPKSSLAEEKARLLVDLPEVAPAWAAEEIHEGSKVSNARTLKRLAGEQSRVLPPLRRTRSQASLGSSPGEISEVKKHAALPPTELRGSPNNHALANAFREFAICRREMRWSGFERLANHCCIFDSRLSVDECQHMFKQLLQAEEQGLKFRQFKHLLQNIAFARRMLLPELHQAVIQSTDLGMHTRQRKVLHQPLHVRRPDSISQAGW